MMPDQMHLTWGGQGDTRSSAVKLPSSANEITRSYLRGAHAEDLQVPSDASAAGGCARGDSPGADAGEAAGAAAGAAGIGSSAGAGSRGPLTEHAGSDVVRVARSTREVRIAASSSDGAPVPATASVAARVAPRALRQAG
jgi:hypothetical protein